ncbi:MAG: amino acid carrier protein, partial [Pseudomonadota bacterium]
MIRTSDLGYDAVAQKAKFFLETRRSSFSTGIDPPGKLSYPLDYGHTSQASGDDSRMIDLIKTGLTLYFILPLIGIFGLYLSFRLRFIQILKLKTSFQLVQTQKQKGGISTFNALAAILGGNLGTGNISGIGVALAAGGPGALFWMWVMALLASLVKYVGCYLGVHYRQKDSAGEYVGGPMYYLEKGLKAPSLAKLFCVLTVTSALTVGNLVQVHSLSLPIKELSIAPWVFGVGLAALVGGVIWGGLQRFAHVVSALVPLMALIYVSTCVVILVFFYDQIVPALALIVSSAFSSSSVTGGMLGYTLFEAIRSGFDRGLFATDSGLGLAPIIHAAVTDTHESLDNRVVQGLVSILSPIIVMVVCTMTGTVLLVTGAWQDHCLQSTRTCIEAF